MAIVLVSQLFLISHAYLKDSSIRIRASTLTSRFHSRSANGSNVARTARTAIQSALRQAQLQPSDLQVVEARQGATRQLGEILGDACLAQPQEPWSSSDALSATTGWRDLCRLGQADHRSRLRQITDNQHSLPTPRLGDQHPHPSRPKLPAIHQPRRRRSRCARPLPFRRPASPGMERHQERARRQGAARVQPCCGGARDCAGRSRSRPREGGVHV